MRAVRFFTIPTILGWLAAYATCCTLHFFSRPYSAQHPAVFRDYLHVFYFGGLLIVLPSFLLVILPVSVVNYFAVQNGREFSGIWYVVGLLALGLVYAFATSLTDTAWLWGRRDLFFLPFVPFAVVVMFRVMKKRANQSPEPTALSVTPRADARAAPASTVAHL